MVVDKSYVASQVKTGRLFKKSHTYWPTLHKHMQRYMNFQSFSIYLVWNIADRYYSAKLISFFNLIPSKIKFGPKFFQRFCSILVMIFRELLKVGINSFYNFFIWTKWFFSQISCLLNGDKSGHIGWIVQPLFPQFDHYCHGDCKFVKKCIIMVMMKHVTFI